MDIKKEIKRILSSDNKYKRGKKLEKTLRDLEEEWQQYLKQINYIERRLT